MSSRAPSRVQIARAQWLLGLDAPASTEEIRNAWKERVARTHPDRNAERAGAATRVTAAFNQARELCEWWLEAGEPWPKPMPPEALRTPEPERVVRPAISFIAEAAPVCARICAPRFVRPGLCAFWAFPPANRPTKTRASLGSDPVCCYAAKYCCYAVILNDSFGIPTYMID